MFQFYWPWMALLLPFPLLALLWRKPNPYLRSAPLRFPGLEQLQQAFSGSHFVSSSHGYRWYWLILAVLWVGLVGALMRPQQIEKMTQMKHHGYDLMLAVDLSGSMKALDFSTRNSRVSRLDVTKQVVKDFVTKRQGDRIGMVVFGDHAYVHVPLTADGQAVSQMLDNTVSGMAGEATAIGDAIGLAVKNLRDRPEGSRVIILLTDGEDTASDIPPLEAAKLAKQYGIRVYTIGIGKEGEVPYPTRTGRIRMVEMRINKELLNQIASLTDGQSFLATDKQGLEAIYQRIDQLEKTQADIKEYVIREPLYRYPLAVSLAALCLLSLGHVIRRRPHVA